MKSRNSSLSKNSAKALGQRLERKYEGIHNHSSIRIQTGCLREMSDMEETPYDSARELKASYGAKLCDAMASSAASRVANAI